MHALLPSLPKSGHATPGLAPAPPPMLFQRCRTPRFQASSSPIPRHHWTLQSGTSRDSSPGSSRDRRPDSICDGNRHKPRGREGNRSTGGCRMAGLCDSCRAATAAEPTAANVTHDCRRGVRHSSLGPTRSLSHLWSTHSTRGRCLLSQPMPLSDVVALLRARPRHPILRSDSRSNRGHGLR
jgi:hypothetical protein